MPTHKVHDFRAALHAGDYSLAEKIGLYMLNAMGEDPEWLNEVGLLYSLQGDFEKSLEYLTRSQSAMHDFQAPLLNSSIILSELGFYEEGLAKFNMAIEQDQSLPMFRPSGSQKNSNIKQNAKYELAEKFFELSLIYWSLYDIENTKLYLSKSLELCLHSDRRLLLARIQLNTKDYTAAKNEIEQILLTDPLNKKAIFLLAEAYILLNNFSQASKTLEQVLPIDDEKNISQKLSYMIITDHISEKKASFS